MLAIMTFTFMFMFATTQGVIAANMDNSITGITIIKMAKMSSDHVGSETTLVDYDYLISYTPHAPIVIDEESDFLVFPGNGSVENPYRIENLEIISSGDTPAISVHGISNVYYVISNCVLSGTEDAYWGTLHLLGYGIVSGCTIDNSTNGLVLSGGKIIVENSIIKRTSSVGIKGSTNGGVKTIRNNTFMISNGVAIDLYPSNVNATIDNNVFETQNPQSPSSYIRVYDNATIINNRLSSSTTGIEIKGDNSVVRNNTIVDCTKGIAVEGGFSKIYTNTIFGCAVGMTLDGNHSLIYENLFKENNAGLSLWPRSSNNMIYGNTFMNIVMNALDSGFSNLWDDGISQGNAWNDYPSSTIGVYNVSGNANSIDRWPTYIGEEPPTTPTTTSTELRIEVLMLIAGSALIVVVILVSIVIFRRR